MPDETMQRAASELQAAVLAMKELVEREYPSRREVERRFLSKDGQNKRWATILALVLVAALLGFIGTVSTVSSCFLNRPDETPAVCNLMPGFKETQVRNQRIIDRFERLDEITRKNGVRLDNLERR